MKRRCSRSSQRFGSNGSTFFTIVHDSNGRSSISLQHSLCPALILESDDFMNLLSLSLSLCIALTALFATALSLYGPNLVVRNTELEEEHASNTNDAGEESYNHNAYSIGHVPKTTSWSFPPLAANTSALYDSAEPQLQARSGRGGPHKQGGRGRGIEHGVRPPSGRGKEASAGSSGRQKSSEVEGQQKHSSTRRKHSEVQAPVAATTSRPTGDITSKQGALSIKHAGIRRVKRPGREGNTKRGKGRPSKRDDGDKSARRNQTPEIPRERVRAAQVGTPHGAQDLLEWVQTRLTDPKDLLSKHPLLKYMPLREGHGSRRAQVKRGSKGHGARPPVKAGGPLFRIPGEEHQTRKH